MKPISYDYNLSEAAVRRDPYAVFAQMRQCGDIHWNEKYQAWFVVGYAEARELLKNPHLSSDILGLMQRSTFPRSSISAAQPLWDLLKSWLLFSDPPYHTHLRKPLNVFFSKANIDAQRKNISAFVTKCLNNCAGKCDLIETIAKPLPIFVISTILGLPLSDIELFREWNDALADFIDLRIRTPETVLPALQAVREQEQYFNDLIKKSSAGDSFIAQMANIFSHAELLNPYDLWRILSLLLATGSATTANLIGNGMYALLTHPEQWELLEQDTTLIPQAIREILRYDPPVQSVFRKATKDILFHDCKITQGEFLQIILAAVNRDPQQFEQPEQFNILRHEDKHLSFGYGIHFCLGWMLAQTIGKIFLEEIITKIPIIQLCEQSYDWTRGVMLRGLNALWLTSR